MNPQIAHKKSKAPKAPAPVLDTAPKAAAKPTAAPKEKLTVETAAAQVANVVVAKSIRDIEFALKEDTRKLVLDPKLEKFLDSLTPENLSVILKGRPDYKQQRALANSFKPFATREYNGQMVAYANAIFLSAYEFARRAGVKEITASTVIAAAIVAGFQPPKAQWVPTDENFLKDAWRFLAGYLASGATRGLYRLVS